MTPSPIAEKARQDMQSASWTREMFERGLKLKAMLGEDHVFDFSLGNPNASPPDAFFNALEQESARRIPALHRYMPNAGYIETREAIARFLSVEYRFSFSGQDLILTSGAAGAMNVLLHAICNPGDEVIVLAPFFSEYRFYIEHAGATVVRVQTDEMFEPDLNALEAAITPRTRAILLNSPNNPTGAVYSSERCRELAELLKRHDSDEAPLYLVLDDPYRRILYDLDWCPTPASDYSRSVIVSSYSKDLSVPGERLGYIAVPPALPGQRILIDACTMLNRTLGYVNAAAFMQRVVRHCADVLADLSLYRRNRDLLCDALLQFGYDLKAPRGALYAFPRSPIPDDARFVDHLTRYNILTVPGQGFGRSGYIRICFAVETKVVERALPGFKAALETCRP